MKNTENDISDPDRLRRRIDFLKEMVTEERFLNMRAVLRMRTRYMTVCTENMFHPQNASAIVRHCDAFGIQDMHTVEETCRFKPNVDIVRGSDRWINIHRHFSTGDAVGALKAGGYRIVATMPHEGDTTPEMFDVKKGKFAIVLGTEHAGVSGEILRAADEYLRIPMAGFVESLNVSACGAIMIYMLSQKIRAEVGDWELTELEKTRTLCDWLRRSVRKADQILLKAGL